MKGHFLFYETVLAGMIYFLPILWVLAQMMIL
jgi:hypothetical protein